jgi:hypothetical protein
MWLKPLQSVGLWGVRSCHASFQDMPRLCPQRDTDGWVIRFAMALLDYMIGLVVGDEEEGHTVVAPTFVA